MSGVKCTDRKRKTALLLAVSVLVCALTTGCGRLSYDMAYDADYSVSSFNVIARQDSRLAEAFAGDICVTTGDVAGDGDLDMSRTKAAALFSLSDNNVLFAYNPHQKLSPASLTKIMTALVALENGSLDQTLTATSAVNITEAGAQLLGLKVGDTMTLDQALRILLLYSANDVAMLIAEGVGGTVDHFVELMNAEAKRIGATNTNFVNPHGLTAENHYTTAYDLYLIFNQAIQNETFREIIQMTSYQTTYYDKSGNPKSVDKTTTNLFLRGDYQPPSNVTVIGGKTGTTKAAGHCLILLTRNVNGALYISIILGGEASDTLYQDMTLLLGKQGSFMKKN